MTEMTDLAGQYLQNHPEMLEVHVQGPKGRDKFRPGSWDNLTSGEYGPVHPAYILQLANQGLVVYGQASSVSAEFDKYEVKFEAGVLQVFGYNGKLIEAYAPNVWSRITKSGS